MMRDVEYGKEMTESIVDFRLPRYQEIPGVGLYLEQTAKYINEYLAPLGYPALTGSMISNYVKKGLVSSPVKKQYSREQIAKLMFISVAKSVIRIEDLGVLLSLYVGRYDTQVAYDYFCMEFENVLQVVFGLKEQLDRVGETNSDLKMMLRTGIIAVAHKVYLDQCFDVLRRDRE